MPVLQATEYIWQARYLPNDQMLAEYFLSFFVSIVCHLEYPQYVAARYSIPWYSLVPRHYLVVIRIRERARCVGCQIIVDLGFGNAGKYQNARLLTR